MIWQMHLHTKISYRMMFKWACRSNSSALPRCMPVLLILFSFLLVKPEIVAQDVHFSQFYNAPLLTNPANSGISGENIRFANSYRSQWSKIGVPFKSLYTSLDKKIPVFGQSFGIGGAVVHDQSSAYNLTADVVMVSLSFSRIIKNQQFSIGIQPSMVFKSCNVNGLTFGEQFEAANQLFNSNLSSLENGLTGNMHYFDLNAGISWRTLIHNIMPEAGLSFRHIFRPTESFSTGASGLKLPVKMTLTGQVNISLNSKFDVTPSFLYGYTSGTSETLIGGLEGYSIQKTGIPVKKIYTVTMVRINPMSNFDAFILGCGLNLTNFDVGLTYDINISPLSKATNFNGAFEISLVYTGGSVKKSIAEPCYIY
jgi:type IX secretion system PorP/SprF family membrane protein